MFITALFIISNFSLSGLVLPHREKSTSIHEVSVFRNSAPSRDMMPSVSICCVEARLCSAIRIWFCSSSDTAVLLRTKLSSMEIPPPFPFVVYMGIPAMVNVSMSRRMVLLDTSKCSASSLAVMFFLSSRIYTISNSLFICMSAPVRMFWGLPASWQGRIFLFVCRPAALL